MACVNNFVADTVVQGKAYPALAKWQATPYTPEWRQFVQHWPNTVPVELYEHFNTHGVDYTLLDFNSNYTSGAYYTIGIGFFNFDVDYFKLMDRHVFSELQAGRIQALFYYHEGDNPYHIKSHIDTLCIKHDLNTNCYKVVSGNTQADSIKNFAYFPDHELLYWHRNRKIPATPVHTNKRLHDFTVFSRTHKWWRANTMARLWSKGLHEKAYFSYNNNIDVGDTP